MSEFSNEPLLEIIYQFIPHDKMFLSELVYNYRSDLLAIGQCLQIGSTAVLVRNNLHTQELLDFLDGNGFILRRGFGFPTLIEVVPQYPKVTITTEFEEQIKELQEKVSALAEQYASTTTTWQELKKVKIEDDLYPWSYVKKIEPISNAYIHEVRLAARPPPKR